MGTRGFEFGVRSSEFELRCALRRECVPTITRFEDIDAWQKARELARLVYQGSTHGDFSRDFALRDQMRRAAVSVLSNIAEGFGRGGNLEFRHFLSVAKGSVVELKAQLYVALDVGFLTQQQFEEVYSLATDAEQLIGGFIRYLAAAPVKGPKFK
jgi:four helix bundle protein